MASDNRHQDFDSEMSNDIPPSTARLQPSEELNPHPRSQAVLQTPPSFSLRHTTGSPARAEIPIHSGRYWEHDQCHWDSVLLVAGDSQG